jgi:hypothetical protein
MALLAELSLAQLDDDTADSSSATTVLLRFADLLGADSMSAEYLHEQLHKLEMTIALRGGYQKFVDQAELTLDQLSRWRWQVYRQATAFLDRPTLASLATDPTMPVTVSTNAPLVVQNAHLLSSIDRQLTAAILANRKGK